MVWYIGKLTIVVQICHNLQIQKKVKVKLRLFVDNPLQVSLCCT